MEHPGGGNAGARRGRYESPERRPVPEKCGGGRAGNFRAGFAKNGGVETDRSAYVGRMGPLRDRTAWFQGGRSLCLQPPLHVQRTWRLVLLGPPGVGKGTQAHLLASALGACPLSTGDIFRAAQAYEAPPGTEMGEALSRIDRGELVPDDVVLSLIHDRRSCLSCRGGFTLDGYPRTIPQAISLDALLAANQLHLDAVIAYELPLHQLEDRVTGRRTCPRCHAVYHLKKRPPRVGGVCDRCGEIIEQRSDDRPDAVQRRLEAYVSATSGVTDHYQSQGILIRISAEGDPADVFAETLNRLAEREVPAPA